MEEGLEALSALMIDLSERVVAFIGDGGEPMLVVLTRGDKRVLDSGMIEGAEGDVDYISLLGFDLRVYVGAERGVYGRVNNGRKIHV